MEIQTSVGWLIISTGVFQRSRRTIKCPRSTVLPSTSKSHSCGMDRLKEAVSDLARTLVEMATFMKILSRLITDRISERLPDRASTSTLAREACLTPNACV